MSEYSFGWIYNPIEVDKVLATMERPYFAQAAPHLKGTGENKDVFYWELEEKILGRVLPSWNQGSVGSCFPAGTRIRMSNGTYKSIEKIFLHDEVLTAEGNKGKVINLFSRKIKEKIINLKLWGHNTLKLTKEHPVLTKRGYIESKDLKTDDWVAIPKYIPNNKTKISPKDYIGRTRTTVKSDNSRKFFDPHDKNKTFNITMSPLPDIINLNENTGRIFGYFLAEGSTDTSRVVWTFNINEADTYVKDIRELIKTEWNAETHIQYRNKNNTIKVVLYGTLWAKLFEALFSNGAGNKKLHQDIASGEKSFMKGLFDGWMAGDGYATRRKEKNLGVTISKDLALSMYDIATYLGKKPVLYKCTGNYKNKDGIPRKQRWEVKTIAQKDSWRVEETENYCYRKVKNITEEDFDGFVFNLEIEGDNSYVAEGVGVHNCVSFGWGRACQDSILVGIAKGKYEWKFEVATEPIYGGSRVEVGGGRIPGDGSIGAWAAKWVKDWGLLYMTKYLNDKYDLTKYSESRARQWGYSGVPNDLEPIAKENPVKEVALITTVSEAVDALANYKPISICGSKGRTMKRQTNGFCPVQGSWAHCQSFRGVCVAKGNRPAVVYQNSWGDYLGSTNNKVTLESGREITLPQGCYLSDLDDIESELRQRDTFAVDDAPGWPVTDLSWFI